MPRKSTFNELCRKIVTSVDVASRKILQHNDEPNLDRLRRGDFARESSEIEPFLADARTRLAEYDNGINQLEAAFNRLKTARSAFKHSIDIASTLMAPVHRLPEDVLVEIFSIYIAISVPEEVMRESPLYDYYRTVSFAFYDGGLFCPTLKLSHVCTFWRKVTFSRPTLWASLSLELDVITGSERDSDNLLSLLSHYLSHSSQHPLNVNLYTINNTGGPIQTQAFKMLIGHCARWQCLKLNVYRDSTWTLLLSMLHSAGQPLTLPLLKVLCLPESPYKDHGHPRMLVHVPSLEHLYGRGPASIDGSLELSWEEFRQGNFTELKGIYDVALSGASIGQFLAQTPVLEVCELNATSGLSADVQDRYLVSSLKTLSIDLRGCSPEAWRTLRTPNVTSLELTSNRGDRDALKNNVEEISTMLLQSGCMLRRIILQPYVGVAAYAIGLLRSHPSVENLITSHLIASELEDLLAGLTISEGDVPLAPNLRYLEIQIVGFKVGPRVADHICNMVRTRAGIVDNSHLLPLQEVVLMLIGTAAVTKEVSQDIRSRLAPFTASGLRLGLVDINDSEWL